MSALASIGRAIAPYAIAAAAGAFVWTFAPIIGPAAEVGRLEHQRDDLKVSAKEWERHARGWMVSFALAENRRLGETATARAAFTADAARCDARVAEARRSTRAIERIITVEPRYEVVPDAAGRCPDRRLADPGELRRALQPSG